jgi:hypothetical protein
VSGLSYRPAVKLKIYLQVSGLSYPPAVKLKIYLRVSVLGSFSR